MEPTQQIRLTLPADKRYLSLIAACVQEVCNLTPGLHPSDAYNIQLAVDEAVVNVISHAYHDCPNGPVELDFAIWPDRLVITIRDWGESFDPAQVPEPDLGQPQERGYGMYLMRRLMDSVLYAQSTEDGNQAVLIKLLVR